MKRFDLEAAKSGKMIYTLIEGKAYFASFVGLKKDGRVVIEYDDGFLDSRPQHEVFMVTEKRTVWVNLYISTVRSACYFDSEKEADDTSSGHRIGHKAYPVEIEE